MYHRLMVRECPGTDEDVAEVVGMAEWLELWPVCCGSLVRMHRWTN